MPGLSGQRPKHHYDQVGTLRDALHAAMTLNVFNRHADKVVMANIAQTLNVLHALFLVEGSNFVRTPTYYVYQMYRPHMGAKMVPTKVQAESIGYTGFKAPGKLSALTGSASLNGKILTLTLVNPSLSDAQMVRVNLEGATAREAKATVLTNEDMSAANIFEAANRVTSKPSSVQIEGNGVRINMPKQSLVAATIVLA
jgi:alpha-N-arabinofuranosidase